MSTKRYLILLLLLLLLVSCRNMTPTLPTPVGTAVTLPTAAPTVAPTTISPTDIPPTDIPPTAVPPTTIPPTAVPPTTVPPTAAPTVVPPPTATPPGPSQPVRLTFAPGAVSATADGTLAAGGDSDIYLIRALAGQIMTVAVNSTSPGALIISVNDMNGQLISTDRDNVGVSAALPATGDYSITIASESAAPQIAYSMTVTIPPVSATPVPQRIQFAPGANSAIVTGNLVAGGGFQSYVLRANAGQTMIVVVTADPAGPVTVFVRDVGGQLLASGPDGTGIQVSLPATGDYYIDVSSAGAAPAVAYSLEVAIPSSTPPTAQPVRIQFAPGSSSATVNESLAYGGDVDTFVLRALAGQEMTVNITANEAGWMNFFVYNQNNEFLASGTDATGLSINLPATQDYYILVSSINAGPPLNYAMTVTIQ